MAIGDKEVAMKRKYGIWLAISWLAFMTLLPGLYGDWAASVAIWGVCISTAAFVKYLSFLMTGHVDH